MTLCQTRQQSFVQRGSSRTQRYDKFTLPEKFSAIEQRAELIGATHAYRILVYEGEALIRWKFFVIFQKIK